MSEEATHAGGQSMKNKVAGMIKETAGRVLGREAMAEEGEAQQDRAGHQADVARHEIDAERAKQAAREDLDRQRAAADDESGQAY